MQEKIGGGRKKEGIKKNLGGKFDRWLQAGFQTQRAKKILMGKDYPS